ELQARLEPLRRRLEPLRRQTEDAVRQFAPELPERPEAEPEATDEDEADWLFSTTRTYLQQIAAYHTLMPPSPPRWNPKWSEARRLRREQRRRAEQRREKRPPPKG